MFDRSETQRQGVEAEGRAAAGKGGRGMAGEQRRFVLGLLVITGVWAPLFVYMDRDAGRGVAVIFGGLSLVALSGYVLFHRRQRMGQMGATGSGGRVAARVAVLGVSLIVGLAGSLAFHAGAHRLGQLGLAVSALSLLAWVRIGSGAIAGEHTAGDTAPRVSSPAPEPGGVAGMASYPRPAAQIDFLWGLSALVLCGFLVVFVVAVPDFQRPAPVLGVMVFGSLTAVVFARLVRMTWPILAAPGGAGLVKGALIASGVFVVGLGTMAYIVTSSIPELLGSSAASGQAAELVRLGPARISVPEPVTWPRPLPGDADLLELGASDLNVRRGGPVFQRVADAVVTIRTARSHGTAFLITRDGFAITNKHVIEGGGAPVALFRDGRELPVRVVRSSSVPDVTLLQIACTSDCATVEVAGDSELRVGGEILVIGTPEAEMLHHSMTRGIVSNLHFEMGATVIQTDAAINAGNSGSPIIDASSGRVLGIVTSSLRGSDIEGVHFGLAIWDALRELGIRPAAPTR